MPPSDNTNIPSPNPTQGPDPVPQKEGFFAKLVHQLFHQKPASSPTPLNPAPEDPTIQTDGAADQQPVEPPQPLDQQTDPTTGAPQAPEPSAPDADSETTAPEIAVPPSLEVNPGEETPTLPTAPPESKQGSDQSDQQPPAPYPPQNQ